MAAAPFVQVEAEVAAALSEGRPVALESTVVSHGLPWPGNLQTARELQAEVRAHGALPATVAVIDGRLQVGLRDAELERLARAGPATAKASRRDLGLLMSRGMTGATTVAATMIAAHAAGIRVFATGGIGGVHRGAGASFDISADLLELARTPVAVVCAGAKAILDIGLTLELLETHGVPVVGYRCERFPAFWSRDSGHPVDARLDEPAEVAAAMRAHWALPGGGGLVVAQPIPEALAMPREAIEAAIAQALADAAAQGVAGKAVTPFLLARVERLTGGASVQANVQLLRHNARLAAGLACAWAAGAA